MFDLSPLKHPYAIWNYDFSYLMKASMIFILVHCSRLSAIVATYTYKCSSGGKYNYDKVISYLHYMFHLFHEIIIKNSIKIIHPSYSYLDVISSRQNMFLSFLSVNRIQFQFIKLNARLNAIYCTIRSDLRLNLDFIIIIYILNLSLNNIYFTIKQDVCLTI